MIIVGQGMDGRLVLGSNQAFPAEVKYVEYYRDQRLFTLVFDTYDEETTILPREMSENTAAVIHSSPNIMVIAMAEEGQNPYGYTVPLVQIGI